MNSSKDLRLRRSRELTLPRGFLLKLNYSKHQRLRSASEFQRVYDLRQTVGDRRLLIFAAVNHLTWTRIGLSVSRKHGSAVKRARLKRLLREAFRLSQHELPRGLDLILIPRVGDSPTLDDFRDSLQRLSKKAASRFTST